FLQIAAKDERRAIVVRLAKFVARRDVDHAFVQIQVFEPRSLADVEVIDRMKVVIEPGQRHLARTKATAIGEAPLSQKDAQAGAGEIGAEDQAVMPGADDDAVIGFFQRLGQKSNSRQMARSGRAVDCRSFVAPVNGWSCTGRAEMPARFPCETEI